MTAIRSADLMNACRSGEWDPLIPFLSAPNTYDEKGGFLLIRFVDKWASQSSAVHEATLRRLVTVVDVNLPHEKTGKTALHEAASFGNLVAMKILCSAGANVNAEGVDRTRPLAYCASFAGNAQAIDCLLSHGALIDAQNKGGYTALTYAILEDQLENARVLLARGARQDLPTPDDLRRVLSHNTPDRMKELLQEPREKWIRDIGTQSTDRLSTLLGRSNPLEEAILSKDRGEVNSLMAHPDFTFKHLESAFKYVIDWDKCNPFTLDIFRDKVELFDNLLGVLDVLQKNEHRVTQNIKTFQERVINSEERTTLSPEDFGVGCGDPADRAQASQAWKEYQCMKASGAIDRNLAEARDELHSQRKLLSQIKEKIQFLNELKTSWEPIVLGLAADVSALSL